MRRAARASYSAAVFYSIAGKNWAAGMVTSDGVVVRATANFRWACGHPIGEVLAWAKEHDVHWSVSGTVPQGLALYEPWPARTASGVRKRGRARKKRHASS